MKGQRAARIDVAILVGVSQAAISQVLIWRDSTRQKETRQRLLDVFVRLGFVLNRSAQRFEPLRDILLTKIYNMVQHHKNMIKNLFEGKGGGETISF